MAKPVRRVSTHSRLKAAGFRFMFISANYGVSTHSRLKAAGLVGLLGLAGIPVSTHSRLKAAGILHKSFRKNDTCFNTQPPEGGWAPKLPRINQYIERFQHTAA